MSRKKILIFTQYYLPGFKAGGPIRSIANIVNNLSDTFEFYIVTKDRDSFERKSYPNVQINTWSKVGGANVYYVSGNLSYRALLSLLKEEDFKVLYLNSFFSYRYSLLPFLINRTIHKKKRLKVLIAPRGEFSKGALTLKHVKKNIFIKTVDFLNLYRKCHWHASNKYEKLDIENVLGSRTNISIAPNIPDIVNKNITRLEFSGILKLIFLSRVSPKKNLDFALKVLSKVKSEVQFNIYGLKNQTYWEKCKEIISCLPPNIEVNYRGIVENSEVPSILTRHHLFFLPTKGENYGHAIAESLLNGIPVLISDQTPWRNLQKNNVGWDLSLDNEMSFADMIDKYYDDLHLGSFLNPDHIREWVLKEIDYKKIIEKNKLLFNLFN